MSWKKLLKRCRSICLSSSTVHHNSFVRLKKIEKIRWPVDSPVGQQVMLKTHPPHEGSDHQPHDCLLKRSFKPRSKKTSKLRVSGSCKGNSSVTGEFPTQRVSYVENVSIWWRHHVVTLLKYGWILPIFFTFISPALIQWYTWDNTKKLLVCMYLMLHTLITYTYWMMLYMYEYIHICTVDQNPLPRSDQSVSVIPTQSI